MDEAKGMRRVGEIMIPVAEYPSVRDNETLADAIRIIKSSQLEARQRKSLPRELIVFDEIHVMVGSLRRRDIMRGLEPHFLVSEPLDYRYKIFDVAVDPDLSSIPHDRLVKGIRENANRPVSDVMRPVQSILKAEDHVIKAVYEMVSSNLTLIPVVKDEQLVGVVRSVDAFHELTLVLE